MSEEKKDPQSLTDAEITEVKQPRRKFLTMGAAAIGLFGVAMSATGCGADRCDTDDGTDTDTGSRADPVGGGRFDRCDTDGA